MSLAEASVFEAAERLTKEGKNPSITEVRRTLGNRGSYGTISEHLKTWRNLKEYQVEIASTPDEVNAFARQVWISASRKAIHSIEETKKRLEEEKKELLSDLDRLLSENELKDHQISELELGVQERDKKIGGLNESLNLKVRDHEHLKQALSESASLQTQTESKFKEQLEEAMRSEIKFQSEEERRKEALAKVDHLESKKASLMNEKATILSSLATAVAQKECALESVEDLEEELSEIKESNLHKERELSLLNQTLMERSIRLEEALKQIEEMKKETRESD